MKVFVVMGNDFPNAVFAQEEDAKAYCAEREKERSQLKIHWRAYDFIVRQGFSPMSAARLGAHDDL